MIEIRSLLFILTLLFGAAGAGLAQGPGVSLGFHNDTKGGILVQGEALNGVKGQPFLVTPGKTGYESNLPPGTRNYYVFDSAQPSRVLLFRAPIPVMNHDQVFSVRPGANGLVTLVPKKK
jgi:hypothetical protein